MLEKPQEYFRNLSLTYLESKIKPHKNYDLNDTFNLAHRLKYFIEELSTPYSPACFYLDTESKQYLELFKEYKEIVYLRLEDLFMSSYKEIPYASYTNAVNNLKALEALDTLTYKDKFMKSFYLMYLEYFTPIKDYSNDVRFVV
ncbi:hypothetical protein [Campylobacter fetus]|uniref:hypothetical protein n=1 Tax=Campylobacter fetus TaxID=196 RepID=UPI000FCB24E1|nr:hypothetical protein [Campylobacter fetus]RUT50980.1 hypothetical protein BWK67_00205 [Campylobacter fetus]RUT51708.1 hypothetical protein BWK51_00205 [Campylobacter fetus]